MGQPARPPLERFMEKVDQHGPIPEHRPDLGPCWVWTGAIHPLGYGRFWPGGERGTPSVQAHDWAWEHFRGPIPEGLEPDHLCRVRRCVRVEHLEIVTHQVNTRRGHGFIGEKSRQEHCVNGHPYDETNTAYRPNGTRRCRRCNVRWVRESRHRTKAIA